MKICKCRILFASVVFFSWSVKTIAVTVSSSFPKLYTIGVIPSKTEVSGGSVSGIEQKIERSGNLFSKMVRNSHRFNVLDDELVSLFWQESSERLSLIDEYEIHGFTHLTVVVKEDVVVFIVRLLSVDLNPLLQESVTIDRNVFSKDDKKIEDAFQDLVFRLFNRLPVDVLVTSVQGRFVTLSRGMIQGLRPGDEITLVRPFIDGVHPANHTWENFKSQYIGKAVVVEANNNTAVAHLTSIIYENALQVGDGAKISRTIARSFFDKEEDPTPVDNRILVNIKSLPLVPKVGEKISSEDAFFPLIEDSDKKNKNSSEEHSEKNSVLVAANEGESQQDHAPLVSNQAQLPSNEEPGGVGQFFSAAGKKMEDFFSEEKISENYPNKKIFSLELGQKIWSYDGPNPTGSKIVWYLPINSFILKYDAQFFSKIRYKIFGGMLFGSTKNNDSFNGLLGGGRLYWENTHFPVSWLDTLQLGGESLFDTLSVRGEGFGGYDLVKIAFFAALEGSGEAKQTPFCWRGEFDLIPLNIGRIGYASSRHSIRSSFGWKAEVDVYKPPHQGEIQWGFGMNYQNSALVTKKSIKMNDYELKILANFVH